MSARLTYVPGETLSAVITAMRMLPLGATIAVVPKSACSVSPSRGDQPIPDTSADCNAQKPTMVEPGVYTSTGSPFTVVYVDVLSSAPFVEKSAIPMFPASPTRTAAATNSDVSEPNVNVYCDGSPVGLDVDVPTARRIRSIPSTRVPGTPSPRHDNCDHVTLV